MFNISADFIENDYYISRFTDHRHKNYQLNKICVDPKCLSISKMICDKCQSEEHKNCSVLTYQLFLSKLHQSIEEGSVHKIQK